MTEVCATKLILNFSSPLSWRTEDGPRRNLRDVADSMAESENIDVVSMGGKQALDEDCSVCVAVHIRPLIASELTEGCQTCLSVATGQPQVLLPRQEGVGGPTDRPLYELP
jgi:hypothetical protein